ncbi:MAG: dephospho-CoA kinase [Ruminococcaceae bacterium]|nr:dephospho-CoA kinase [Oscillospiraceae bacterium]
MIVIGLCGASGSGKGYVCEAFKKHGVEFIDTDKVYSTKIVRAGSDCLGELCMFFGKGILNEDGSLNRRALSERVFQGENASEHLKVLNRITHRYILADVEKTIDEYRKNGARAVIVDAPVLFESGFNESCDTTICVTASYDTKLERIIARDKISREKAQARLKSQLPDERLVELCEYEIKNDADHDIEAQVLSIIEKLNLGE